MINPDSFFKHPATAGQKQYEALRAILLTIYPARKFVDASVIPTAPSTPWSSDSKPEAFSLCHAAAWPKGHAYPLSLENKSLITKKQLSAYQIAEVLETLGSPTSVSTISAYFQTRIRSTARRTQLLIGMTKDNTIVPNRAKELDTSTLNGWCGECSVGGIFLLHHSWALRNSQRDSQRKASWFAWNFRAQLYAFNVGAQAGRQRAVKPNQRF